MSIDQQAHQLLKRRIDNAKKHQSNDKSFDIHKQFKKLYGVINSDLLKIIKKHDIQITEQSEKAIRDLNLELEQLREFCEFPDLTQRIVVGFGGAFSAGKSSLINTILGKKRLVTEIDPTTSIPTYLMSGDSDQITVVNHNAAHIEISQDEFLILTHSEKEKYGSSIGENLRVAFIKDNGFQWQNIALLDTPGYSSSDIEQSTRTDANVARAQLNTAQLIVWAVAIDNGTISEEDLNFLSELRSDIPKLIVITRADKKQLEDVLAVVESVRQALVSRKLDVLDVIAVSARKTKDYPITPVIDWLDTWNNAEQQDSSFAKILHSALVSYYDTLILHQYQHAEAMGKSIHQYAEDLASHSQIMDTIAKEQKITPDDFHKVSVLKSKPPKFIEKVSRTLDNFDVFIQDALEVVPRQKDIMKSELVKINEISADLETARQIFLKYLSEIGYQIGYSDWCSDIVVDGLFYDGEYKNVEEVDSFVNEWLEVAMSYIPKFIIPVRIAISDLSLTDSELRSIREERKKKANQLESLIEKELEKSQKKMQQLDERRKDRIYMEDTIETIESILSKYDEIIDHFNSSDISSLRSILDSNKSKLNINTLIYLLDDLKSQKVQKKINQAVVSYANEFGYKPNGTLLLLIDTSAFGDGSHGFYITDEVLYAKPLFEDSFSIRLKDIKRIRLDTDDCIIKINSQELSYTHSEINSAMKVLVDCLKEYIQQFSEE